MISLISGDKKDILAKIAGSFLIISISISSKIKIDYQKILGKLIVFWENINSIGLCYLANTIKYQLKKKKQYT